MQQVLLTVDLGFGDAGKGSIVDFLTRVYAAHTVVRYNGGAQAGHRVVTAGLAPQEHIFAQFGSGTLAGAAITALAPGAGPPANNIATRLILDIFLFLWIDERS